MSDRKNSFIEPQTNRLTTNDVKTPVRYGGSMRGSNFGFGGGIGSFMKSMDTGSIMGKQGMIKNTLNTSQMGSEYSY
jgi:hypothetical protein